MFCKLGGIASQLGFEPDSLVWRAGSLPIKPSGPAKKIVQFLNINVFIAWTEITLDGGNERLCVWREDLQHMFSTCLDHYPS